MDYIRFKRRAIVSQAFSILLVESSLLGEHEMLIVPTVANGVPFAIAYANTSDLDALSTICDGIFIVTPFDLMASVEVLMDILSAQSITTTVSQQLSVNIALGTPSSQNLSSIFSLVWGMHTTGSIGLAVPLASTQSIVFDISMSIPNLAHEIGLETYIALELVTSIVSTIGISKNFAVDLENLFAAEANVEALSALSMTWESPYLLELNSALVRARAKRHIVYLVNTSDVDASFLITRAAKLSDYDARTLGSMDSSALSYLVFYLP